MAPEDSSEVAGEDLTSGPERRRLVRYVAISLNFTIRPEHVRREDRVLSLKCTAEVLELYWRQGVLCETKTLKNKLAI